MSLKIVKISNQWIVSENKDGKNARIGSIKPSSSNSILINFKNEEALLKIKPLETNNVFIIKNNDIEFQSIIDQYKSIQQVKWVETSTKDEFTCYDKDPLFITQSNEKILMKTTMISKTFKVKLIDTTLIPVIILLASIYPIISKSSKHK